MRRVTVRLAEATLRAGRPAGQPNGIDARRCVLGLPRRVVMVTPAS
jgi:hypothetical protein